MCLTCVVHKSLIQKSVRFISEEFKTDLKNTTGKPIDNVHPLFCIPDVWYTQMFILLMSIGVKFGYVE